MPDSAANSAGLGGDVMIVNIEWYGIKLKILGNRYADGDYEIEDIIVCNDKWISREELPDTMLTLQATREIYSLVGDAIKSDDADPREPEDSKEQRRYFIRGVHC